MPVALCPEEKNVCTTMKREKEENAGKEVNRKERQKGRAQGNGDLPHGGPLLHLGHRLVGACPLTGLVPLKLKVTGSNTLVSIYCHIPSL